MIEHAIKEEAAQYTQTCPHSLYLHEEELSFAGHSLENDDLISLFRL